MPVKPMSKSMILNDSHIFLEISFFLEISLGWSINHPNCRPTRWTMRQGPSFKEVDSRLVAFRLIQLRLANGVTYRFDNGIRRVFFAWMFFFWRMLLLHSRKRRND